MIKQYKKRPVVVQAIRFQGTGNIVDCVEFLDGRCLDPIQTKPNIIIRTLEGDMVCAPGDWIIKGVKGEFYPCKPDIFALTYEDAGPSEEPTESRQSPTKTAGCVNFLGPDGNPAGGWVNQLGIQISWQNGPLGRSPHRQEPNGAFVEDVIKAALQRLEWYQTASDKRFACRENELAITKLEEALRWLEDRTKRREAQGIEGTHERD